MGAHGRRRADSAPGRARRIALVVVAPFALATLVALAVLWPTADPTDSGASLPQLDGTIVEISRSACAEELSDDVNGCGEARVRLDAPPPGTPSTVSAPLPNGIGAPEVDDGDHVVVISSTTPDGTVFSIVDHQRAAGLWTLAAAFVLALLAFGRWRGITALLGLGVTFAVLLLFVVPAILQGESPVLVAIVGSAAIMLVVLYLTHGLAVEVSVAVLGTLVSLVLTGLLSALAIATLHLTGVTDDISASVGTVQQVNTQGLLLAGIVIGSLGVLDDVTVTQAVTVRELVLANPRLTARGAYRAASRVGRSHIASVVNTVILAYAGSSLPLLILVVAADDSLGTVLTDQVIAQEIVRSAIATLGLVAAVPVTTGMAAFVLTREASSTGPVPDVP